MKTSLINILLFCFLLALSSCKRKSEPIEIKLLLLNSENYLNQNILIHGKIKEIGPLDLWFVLEDDTGYIQITTQNVSEKINCLKKGQNISAFGQLERYSIHKYFSLRDNLKCL